MEKWLLIVDRENEYEKNDYRYQSKHSIGSYNFPLNLKMKMHQIFSRVFNPFDLPKKTFTKSDKWLKPVGKPIKSQIVRNYFFILSNFSKENEEAL